MDYIICIIGINSKKVKGAKQPNGHLKPDMPGFDPIYYLEYDVSEHVFYPNSNRTITEQDEIKHDIETLGLNWDPIKTRREAYLNPFIRKVKYGQLHFDEAIAELTQFFTAFTLTRAYMES